MRLVAVEEDVGLSPGFRRHFAYAASSPQSSSSSSSSIHETLYEVAAKTRTDILFILGCLVRGRQGGFQIRLGRGTRGKNGVGLGYKRSRCNQKAWFEHVLD